MKLCLIGFKSVRFDGETILVTANTLALSKSYGMTQPLLSSAMKVFVFSSFHMYH